MSVDSDWSVVIALNALAWVIMVPWFVFTWWLPRHEALEMEDELEATDNDEAAEPERQEKTTSV